MNRLPTRLANEQGAITALLAIALPVLLGMGAIVVDLGMTWQARRQLQNCADAAALAGAVELGNQVNAYSMALAYSFSAGPSGCLRTEDPVPDVTFIDRNGDGVSDAVEVIPQRQVRHGLARILGFSFTNVFARAVAGKVIPSGIIDTQPFGLQVDPNQECGMAGITHYTVNGQPLSFGTAYTIKYSPRGADERSPGNFQALALGGTGDSIYRENIVNGYHDWVTQCFPTQDTQTGAHVQPTIDALTTRFQKPEALDDTWSICSASTTRFSECPRVIIIAIILPLQQGHTDAHILTFGWFYVDSYSTQAGQNALMTGRFVDVGDRPAPPGGWRGNTPWDPTSDLPFGVKLLE